jgi:hypothetical protein
MKKQITMLRNKILAAKVYIGRSASYVSLLNMGMIMFLTFSKLREKNLIDLDMGAYFIPLYFATLFLFILFGYIDIKLLKGHKTETDIFNSVTPLHPELADLKKKVDYLYQKEMEVKNENKNKE